MQDLNDKLTVLHSSDGVVFEDVSMSAFNFLKGTFEATDILYVGFRKPINCMYVGIQTGSSDGATLDAEYYSDSWTALDLHDETDALDVSGFVRWVSPSDQTASTIDGKLLFWTKLNILTDTPVVVSGIGPVLCSEEDLRAVDFNLEESSPNILKAMLAARNLMCKEMQVSPWDILNIPDVNDAAVFLSLSNIYFNQSDREDDHHQALGQAYLRRYENLKPKLGILLDQDDDGIGDEDESKRASTVYLER